MEMKPFPLPRMKPSVQITRVRQQTFAEQLREKTQNARKARRSAMIRFALEDVELRCRAAAANKQLRVEVILTDVYRDAVYDFKDKYPGQFNYYYDLPHDMATHVVIEWATPPNDRDDAQ